MKNLKSGFAVTGGCFFVTLYVAASLAIPLAILYVIVHFILKFW